MVALNADSPIGPDCTSAGEHTDAALSHANHAHPQHLDTVLFVGLVQDLALGDHHWHLLDHFEDAEALCAYVGKPLSENPASPCST